MDSAGQCQFNKRTDCVDSSRDRQVRVVRQVHSSDVKQRRWPRGLVLRVERRLTRARTDPDRQAASRSTTLRPVLPEPPRPKVVFVVMLSSFSLYWPIGR